MGDSDEEYDRRRGRDKFRRERNDYENRERRGGAGWEDKWVFIQFSTIKLTEELWYVLNI